MKLIEDLKEFARLLVAHEVRFLVVGGAAVNTLGYLRMTEDFDFWIDRTPENADRLVAALNEFGFGEQFERKDLREPGVVHDGPTAEPDRPADVDQRPRVRRLL
jgi:hypothetical protein